VVQPYKTSKTIIRFTVSMLKQAVKLMKNFRFRNAWSRAALRDDYC